MPPSITMGADALVVPNDPIIPYIEGDGIGPDIWAASVRGFDAAVKNLSAHGDIDFCDGKYTLTHEASEAA